ncbi:MAG: class I SAM-dependent methyltransferase [Rhizobiaceae bacterium]
MADYRDTLILPFEKGVLAEPRSGQHWVMMNAEQLPETFIHLKDKLICEQGFRPTFLDLEKAGFNVKPELEDGGTFHGCLILCSRSRAINEGNAVRAWNALHEGGVLAIAGNKTSGIQSLRKWVGQRVQIAGSLSKHHAVVFWLTKTGASWQLVERKKPVDGFLIEPGMFSASGPDAGSKILARHLDDRVFGHVADFGAGWGYLSKCLLDTCSRVEQLDLFEADHASLNAARINVGDRAQYHWSDLTSEAPSGPFNWIIMNPPFHSGRAALPDLGNQFIEAAARALPAGGRLLMVANNNLPYERTLQSLFKKVERIDQDMGFKVLEAVRGSR